MRDVCPTTSSFWVCLAGRVGFEPTAEVLRPCTHLAGEPNRPLWHLPGLIAGSLNSSNLAGEILPYKGRGCNCRHFTFRDCDRTQYQSWLHNLKQILSPGGQIVADNATTHPSEISSFTDLAKTDLDFTTRLVPLGNGGFVDVKRE